MTIRLLITLAIATTVACGGKAIVDAGAQNQGGGGAGAGGMATTMSGPITTNVNVGVGPGGGGAAASLCADACDSLADCGGPSFDCAANCANIAPACQDFHQRWLSCSLGEINTMCGRIPPEVCGPDLRDYLNCSGILVGKQACLMGNDGSCACDAFISPGITIRQECSPGAGCGCFAGDTVIGFCEEPDATCGISSGCCAGLFFTGPI